MKCFNTGQHIHSKNSKHEQHTRIDTKINSMTQQRTLISNYETAVT
jgi:hypothetical protein